MTTKYYYFEDRPDFTPNLSPREIFELGSFGGTYWREIYSPLTNKNYSNEHKKYKFLRDLPDSIMTKPWDQYDKSINRYGIKVGTTYEYWLSKNWIHPQDPYGWVQWYCEFWQGRRSEDDDRQIQRWKQIKKRFNQDTPAVKQTLQHWGITK